MWIIKANLDHREIQIPASDADRDKRSENCMEDNLYRSTHSFRCKGRIFLRIPKHFACRRAQKWANLGSFSIDLNLPYSSAWEEIAVLNKVYQTLTVLRFRPTILAVLVAEMSSAKHRRSCEREASLSLANRITLISK